VLIEPVSFHLLRQEGRPEWAEVERLTKQCSVPLPRARTGPRQRPS
jgi:hypothetical protein